MLQKVKSKSAVFLCFILTFQLLSVNGKAENSLPFNVILSWTGDTAASMTVSWQTYDADKQCYVKYGTSSSLENAQVMEASDAEAKSGISMDFSIMQATLTGLSAGTTFYYCVGGSSGWSDISHFTTAAADTGDFSFLYMGDIHMDENYGSAWGGFLNSANESNLGMSFGIFGGDIVDNGTKTVQWENLLNAASPVFSKIPLMPANGNHDSNFPSGKPLLYLDLFSLPQNGPEGFKEEFYSFDYGDCHITVLNSWIFSGEQKLGESDYERINKWLADDLNTSSAKWKIVVMHNPVYSLVSDTVSEAVRQTWEPLFEAGGVSLVLCGHQHIYSRSYPMYSGSIDFDKGITYIMGNASRKYYSSADEQYMEKLISGVPVYQVIQISGDTLTVKTYNENGEELDECELQPRSVSEATMTRAMFTAALGQLAGAVPDNDCAAGFNDVSECQWYTGYVAWAAKNGIVLGDGSSNFFPDAAISREQMALMLYRFAKYSGNDIPAAAVEALQKYSDSGEVSSWAQQAVSWAVASGLLEDSDGLLSPGISVTSAEAAQFISNYVSFEKESE